MIHRSLLAALGLFSACRGIDPNQGLFSCTTEADCGEGYECKPQFGGSGRCFRRGTCGVTEICNGVDDTCDGRIDETYADEGKPCTSTTLLGICSAGTKTCLQGAEVCVSTTLPSDERCNQIDDDCDGQTDEDFNLTSSNDNCGQCGRTCTGGTTCRSSACVEAQCDDGLDNDSNGKTDCVDENCLGRECERQSMPVKRCGALVLQTDAGLGDAGPHDAGTPDAGLDGGSANDGGGLIDGGLDASLRDAGVLRGCYSPETTCNDGFDNDGDGLADCLDPDCENRPCFNGMMCNMLRCPGQG